jgi:hypothetical protein
MVPITGAGRKGDARSRPNCFSTGIRDKHKFAIEDIDELVLFGMRMSG